MRIIKRSDATHVSKPEGTNVYYYLFNDYELHYNEQAPHTTQTWHHHEKIAETLYMISGELSAQWREGVEEKSVLIQSGDLVETEQSPHTFSNNNDTQARFLVIKRMPTAQDYSEIFKSDKLLD